jgi:hypothetical protein
VRAPLKAGAAQGRGGAPPRFGKDVLKCAEQIAGLDFTDAEEEAALRGVSGNLVETALKRVASTDRTDPLPALRYPLHHASQLFMVASSTRLTARDMRRHCASSSLKCRRPARVSE